MSRASSLRALKPWFVAAGAALVVGCADETAAVDDGGRGGAGSSASDGGGGGGESGPGPGGGGPCASGVSAAGCDCLAEGDTRDCFAGEPIRAGVGACVFGVETCLRVGSAEFSALRWSECFGSGEPAEETCGNAVDDDCDGATDETCTCRPSAEVCDGVDNDCDPASADGEEDPAVGAPCDAGCGVDCLAETTCSEGATLCAVTATATSTRTVEFSPEEATSGPDVKLLLVVDNSPSMTDQRDRVADGLANLAASFRSVPGLAVEVFVYSTDAYRFAEDLPTWQSATFLRWADQSLHPYDDAAEQAQFVPPDHTDYEAVVRYELAPPVGGGSFLLDAEADEADFDLALGDLDAAVRSIEAAGSDYEGGLCTVAQALAGLGTNAFLSPGDSVAVLVVSDADEYFQSDSCAAEHVQRYTWLSYIPEVPTDDPELATLAWYSASEIVVNYTYEVVQVDPETGERTVEEHDAGSAIDPAAFGIDATCIAAPEPCPTALAAWAEEHAGAPLLECAYRCQIGSAHAQIEGVPPALAVDHCAAPFEVQGTTFADVYDYLEAHGIHPVPGSCQVDAYFAPSGVDAGAYLHDSTYENDPFLELVAGPASTAPGWDALAEKLAAFTGPTNHFVSAVVHHPSLGDDACAAEEVGERYAQFIDTLGAAGQLQSVCSADYASSLDGIAAFATAHVQHRFEVALEDGEFVRRVFVVRAGLETEVPASDLVVVGGSVAILGDAVQPGDVVRLELARYEPV